MTILFVIWTKEKKNYSFIWIINYGRNFIWKNYCVHSILLLLLFFNQSYTSLKKISLLVPSNFFYYYYSFSYFKVLFTFSILLLCDRLAIVFMLDLVWSWNRTKEEKNRIWYYAVCFTVCPFYNLCFFIYFIDLIL